MKISMSKRFRDAYERASLGLKDKAEGAIHDFVNRYRSNPKTVMQSYGRLATLPDVIEIDLTRSHRLLANYSDGHLIMLNMGGHEIVNRYDDNMRIKDLRNHQAAPDFFWPERAGFFRRNPDPTEPFHYQEEVSDEWLYFLEKRQSKVDRKISNRLWKLVDQGEFPPPYIILGGPGTGKTCILLNLLRFYGDLDADFSTGIVLSDQLTEYIEQSTSADISAYRVDPYLLEERLDLLLFDDPGTVGEIEFALHAYKQDRLGAVVIAFDPLQLSDALRDADFQELVAKFGAQVYELSTCYRQKKNVGENTRQVIDMIAKSTPYLHEPKIRDHYQQHSELTKLSNELEFVNPAGYVEYYVEATVPDIQGEVNRILARPWLMWTHSPGLLVVEGLKDGFTLSDSSQAALWPLKQRDYVREVSINDIDSIKGLEFQHVFVFLDLQLFNEIQHGFSGTGRRVYHQRRLFRIPFSRAKDSLVTFALA